MKISEMIAAYSGMIFGKKDYWHPDMVASNNISDKSINDYYVDTRAKNKYPAKLSDEGIPILEVDGKDTFFPITIAQYALGNFDMYYDTKDQKYLDIVEKCSNWFVRELEEVKPNLWGYAIERTVPVYDINDKWISCLAQSQVMSVLVRYYSVCKKEEYLETAFKLLDSFKVLSKDKGVLAYLNNGCFYEEYPSDKPSLVLNGFIFGLWGLLDLYIVSGSVQAKGLYDEGVKTLKENIQLYDIKKLGWSRYDLYDFKIKNITSIFYHKLHINQLKAMYELTGEEIFKSYYVRWEKRKNNIIIYLVATLYKIVHKISVRNKSVYVKSVK